MNNTINEIAASICRPDGDCVKCDVLIIATEIYTAHVKPLEEALTKAQAQNAAVLTEQAAKLLQGVATGITGDAESFRIRMCITCPHCGLVMNSVEEATAHDAVCEKHPAVIRAMKAEADKAALVEALEWHCENCREKCEHANQSGIRTECDCSRCPAYSALAKVKEASCQKN